MSDHESTQDLIGIIERKDRRFRFFQTLFMVGTFVALIIIIGGQQRTLTGVQTQLEEARKTAITQNKASVDARDVILRRLDCLAVYFSQRDRANLTIQNIDECTLNRDGTAQQFFQNNSNGDGGTTVTPTEQAPGATTPTATPTGPVSATPSTPVTPAPTTSQPIDPISLGPPILAQPLCILGLCIQ